MTTGPIFDSYLMVDWSAANAPVTGADSIWIAHRRADGGLDCRNPSTRAAAMGIVGETLAAETAAGRRTLAGFDFPFGYPAGTAARLGCADWRALWALIADGLSDGPDNRNDRFGFAAELNARLAARGRASLPPDPAGPFWATLPPRAAAPVPRRKPAGYGTAHPPEDRVAERYAKLRGARPKPVWQLSGPGSVGGQALTGIAALERLRRDPRVRAAVWPLETGFAIPPAPVTLAEIYPSLFHVTPRAGEVRDRAQVRTVTEVLAALDRAGVLAALFEPPAGLAAPDRAAVVAEEAWILGLGAEEALRAALPSRPVLRPAAAQAAPEEKRTGPVPLRYQRDPAAIYAESFATVRRETALAHLPADLHPLAIRLVHACGMPDITARLAWSTDLVRSARAALESGAPVIADCEMVASGITRARLPAGNPVLCTLNDAEVPERARRIGNTRSAAAVELWGDRMEGAVIAIGNAPTALFRLLELLDGGAPRPAAILAFPVGFVGAAESKAELAARPRGVPFVTLRGRRGGSAMAAAAVNALARERP